MNCYPVGSNDSAAFGAKTLPFDPGQPIVLLRDVIIELSDKILQKHEIPDWYNDYGGYGQIKWSVADTEGIHPFDRIAVTVNVAVVEIDTSNFEYRRVRQPLGSGVRCIHITMRFLLRAATGASPRTTLICTAGSTPARSSCATSGIARCAITRRGSSSASVSLALLL